MDQADLIDLSDELVSIYAISFIVSSCLVLLTGVQDKKLLPESKEPSSQPS